MIMSYIVLFSDTFGLLQDFKARKAAALTNGPLLLLKISLKYLTKVRAKYRLIDCQTKQFIRILQY